MHLIFRSRISSSSLPPLMPFSSHSRQYHTMIDPHWVISAIVVAKAKKVMSEVERSWSYGSKRTEKQLEKTVAEIRTKERTPIIEPKHLFWLTSTSAVVLLKGKQSTCKSVKAKGAEPVVQSVFLEAPLNQHLHQPILQMLRPQPIQQKSKTSHSYSIFDDETRPATIMLPANIKTMATYGE